MAPETVLVVGGRLPSLTAVRALAAAGYRTVAGDGGEYSSVRHSRACGATWRHPPIRDADGFLAALSAFLAQRPDITTVLPVQERYVALLAAARESLPQGVTVAAPDSRVVETCIDKGRLYGVAREAGVPHAAVRGARDLAGLAGAADEIGYPCIVKPSTWTADLPEGRKAIICPDRATLERVLGRWPEGHAELLVQAYVSGPRHNVHFVARSGRILATMQTRSLRTDRIDGTGLSVEAISVDPDPRLLRYCGDLIARLDYSGIGLAQFIVPDEGLPSLLEVNPRPGTGYGFNEACGLGLTIAAVELASAAGRWRSDPDFRYPVGRRYAWTSRDLYALGMAISRREVGPRSAARWLARAVRAAVLADVHGTWRWRDPLPTLAVYAHLGALIPRPRLWRPRPGRSA